MENFKIIFFASLLSLFLGCGTTTTVPVTGRKQHLLVSNKEILSLSEQQYQTYLKESKLSANAQNTTMVKRVGQKLANAVELYLKQHGRSSELSQYEWEFNLVQNTQVNAFCMPGGKIIVYEGLLPITGDEASLAIVLGHEIAHAVAKHSAERISNAYRQQIGVDVITSVGGTVAQGYGVNSSMVQLGSVVLNLGSQVWTSGFSRKQESEADHIGLIFAAMAGYNPEVAVAFWQRMSKATGGGSNSIFSDHPADESRIKQIKGWMPEAKRYYKP